MKRNGLNMMRTAEFFLVVVDKVNREVLVGLILMILQINKDLVVRMLILVTYLVTYSMALPEVVKVRGEGGIFL